MPDQIEKLLQLKYNPFEPSGSGAPLEDEALWMPERWQKKIDQYMRSLAGGRGTKPLAIIGEYGSGKSYLLHWLHRMEFPKRRVRSFYFENPGVQFFDLANSLLRRIGRKHFSRLLWELAQEYVKPQQYTLFRGSYEDYLAGYRKRDRRLLERELLDAIRSANITDDEQIASCLARIIMDTPEKPYFEYRDFLPGGSKSLVAEKEGAKYFAAILRSLRLAEGTDKVAFLIDEFEEISVPRSLTLAAKQDYSRTLKRLIDLTEVGELWLVLAMTKDGARKTQSLDPALWTRCYQLDVEPLEDEDAEGLVKHRLSKARSSDAKPEHNLHPFEPDLIASLQPNTRAVPRWLVKVCFAAVNRTVESRKKIVSNSVVQQVEQELLKRLEEAPTNHE